jgi:hypothetical protein
VAQDARSGSGDGQGKGKAPRVAQEQPNRVATMLTSVLLTNGRKTMRAWCFIAILCLLPLRAMAFRESGSDLLALCDEAASGKVEHFYDAGMCMGFVVGVVDTHQVLHAARLLDQKAFCLPVEAVNGQLMLVVAKYLREHPESLHLAGTALVTFALHDAFPCVKQ